jgi:hypothetical protein
MQKISPASVVWLLGFALTLNAAERPGRITVLAGDYDRRNSVVWFTWPSGARDFQQLADERGNTIALQTDQEGHACFIEKELKHGSARTYRLVAAESDASLRDGVQVAREGNRIKCSVANQPVFHYQADASELPRPDIKPIFQRGGFLHPILTPGGKLVTDDYPPNHLHHHGIWFPWTKTDFEGRQPDFWNMGEGKGRVEFAAVGETWSGLVHGGLNSRHRFVDLSAAEPKVALNETWQVTLYNVGRGAGRYWMFDLVSTQQCATASPLRLPKYHYGGLGFRGNWTWNGKDKTSFLTSEGETDRVKGNETRGRWCHISGDVDGARAGIAILCHPDNFRAPQPMRLHPTEPFFCFAPSQLGDWEISPGKPYVSRYRFIVADGPPDNPELERLWNDYAHPPIITID